MNKKNKATKAFKELSEHRQTRPKCHDWLIMPEIHNQLSFPHSFLIYYSGIFSVDNNVVLEWNILFF